MLALPAVAALLGLMACNKTATQTADGGDAAKNVATPEPTPPPPPPRSSSLPEGTALRVRLMTQISTESHQTGELFTATLEAPVMEDGQVALPKGTRVEGVVAEADKGGRVEGVATLALRLTKVDLPGGGADLTTNTVVHKARTTRKRDAAKVGIGAGVGAAIGAIAGGGRGAAIGAGVGAGAGGATVLATRGEPATFPAESVVSFTLRAPVTLSGTR
jgi:hypothetical protein